MTYGLYGLPGIVGQEKIYDHKKDERRIRKTFCLWVASTRPVTIRVQHVCKTDLNIFHQPNIEKFTTQMIFINGLVFICFCLSYDNHGIINVISHAISRALFKL